MAFGKGNASTEGFERKLYEGFASCKILAVNPTAEEIKKYRGFEPKEEPVYLSEVEVNGKMVKQMRVEFLLQVNPDKYVDNDGNKIDIVVPLSIFLRNAPRVGSQSGKTQIIDNYARTAWATPDELTNHLIPATKSGPARIAPNYRKARDGEAEILNLIQCQLNMGNVEKWEKVDGVNVYKGLVDNPADCECYFNDIAKFFTGDIHELKEAVSMMPDNEFKALLCVRHSDDGKLYQQVYSGEFLKNRVSDYSRITARILDSQALGAMPNIKFYFGDLHEYSVEPTTFDKPQETSVENPWE